MPSCRFRYVTGWNRDHQAVSGEIEDVDIQFPQRSQLLIR